MVRKTKEEALETRNLILDTAEAVFHEKGVAKTSLNEIAEKASLTRGAIYWHFKNKADLFDAMMQRVILPMEEFVAKSEDENLADPVTYLRESALRVMLSMVTDARTRRVFEIVLHRTELVDDMLPIRDRHLAGRQGCITKLTLGIQNAVNKGALAAGTNPRLAALGMHSLIDGLIANWVLAPDEFDLMEHAEFAVDTYLNGLGYTAKTR